MRRLGQAYILFLICIGTTCLPALLAAEQNALTGRLAQTRATNIESIIDGQFRQADKADGFRVPDPYKENSAETVQLWEQGINRDKQVCAIRFLNDARSDYELRGFASESAAASEGFTVTHQGRCGSCSTLRDLSVYLSTPDLTSPARQCARKIGLKRKKQCFQEQVGFTPYCAESWAYNALQTRRECLGACVSDYGFFNLLLNRYPGSNTDENGQLRPCLQCDEEMSGAGFKYSAGRTRRNSGLVSAIERFESEIYPVDHSAYFR